MGKKLYKNKEIVEIVYGIAQAKRDKYAAKMDKLIRLYNNQRLDDGEINKDYHKMDLLRHRIAAFTSRTVYQTKRYKSMIWKTKGFIGNYGELRYLLDSQVIDSDTKIFLKNMVEEAFARASLQIPYFIKGATGKSGYSLYENMKANKTLLLVEQIGYSKHALKKLCKQVGINLIDEKGKERGYRNLVRTYLIELKVGY